VYLFNASPLTSPLIAFWERELAIYQRDSVSEFAAVNGIVFKEVSENGGANSSASSPCMHKIVSLPHQPIEPFPGMVEMHNFGVQKGERVDTEQF